MEIDRQRSKLHQEKILLRESLPITTKEYLDQKVAFDKMLYALSKKSVKFKRKSEKTPI